MAKISESVSNPIERLTQKTLEDRIIMNVKVM